MLISVNPDSFELCLAMSSQPIKTAGVHIMIEHLDVFGDVLLVCCRCGHFYIRCSTMKLLFLVWEENKKIFVTFSVWSNALMAVSTSAIGFVLFIFCTISTRQFLLAFSSSVSLAGLVIVGVSIRNLRLDHLHALLQRSCD